MTFIEDMFASAGGYLWEWAVLPLVACLGLYFTIRTGVVQLRFLPHMMRLVTDRRTTTPEGGRGISSFQAFTVSAASRVGVGNIAGVGTAIVVGGPGAVFWMWLMAFVGGASSFIESTLGQLYKVREGSTFRGGPAHYITRGLKARWAGVLFAVILIVCFPFAFSSLQANTIGATLAAAVGGETPGWLMPAIGIILAALTAAVIFGGARRIASVTAKLVPSMALLYLMVGLVIVVLNFDHLGTVFGQIVGDAFSGQSVAGGAIGTVIMVGVQRGMFSNEAGLGSVPNAAASANVSHPVKQGLVQTLGVYFDTFLVCSITAFIILVTAPELAGAERGIALTQGALVDNLGSWTTVLLALVIFLLAFSSILGNYFYGESNLEFIARGRTALAVYRTLAVAAVFGGTVASASLVWTAADAIMGVMALVNLVAIAFLSPIAFRLLRDYGRQLREGRDPEFRHADMPDLEGIEAWGPRAAESADDDDLDGDADRRREPALV
ncbi:alanine/glycine:cation symporter family protein [Demequina pelophila]|uniref:alanine/glycine:cation symporter family protein n=1 Tax=Demequina pelophila TaxID=1638984 RepID=UPI0009E38431|nr:alanine/glycine:cation symporter family protein [Demequina pelophila]